MNTSGDGSSSYGRPSFTFELVGGGSASMLTDDLGVLVVEETGEVIHRLE